ncbi:MULTISPECIES: hypothetical protein [Paraclostridium]|uniref:hypothetical protein n=1 Tax=Paraclostridium TaxID=1849822 RepID=UPI001CC783A1|nr:MULTISPECIES: hypothetical protein [Paraclostridium]MBZ6006768.1 hypothetical protein [Paraclostridium bifermentans]MDU0297242.1 hypothetical protein [Paraclostridium sp. MRS3W1]
MIIFNTLIESFFNLASVLGVFIVFGILLNLIEAKNNELIQSSLGIKFIVFTGFIGTIVHELSHMLMAFIFNHKIVKVELFRPFKYKEDGVLGYVKHTYNPSSLYQQIGNFFIGIAPMIFGTLFIWILLILFSNDTYKVLTNNIHIDLYIKYLESTDYLKVFSLLINDTLLILKSIVSLKYLADLKHLIMLFFIYSIATHMSLSLADLKGSFKGFIVCFIIVFIVTLFINLLNQANLFNNILIFKFNVYVFLFLTVGLIFSLLTLFVSFLINIIKNSLCS